MVNGYDEYSSGRNYFDSVQDATAVSKPKLKAVGKTEGKSNQKGSEENPHGTSRAARRDAMRKGGVPTSQPLQKDKVYLDREGNWTVQDAKNDSSHEGKPHWEAGWLRKDGNLPDGINRSGNKVNKHKCKMVRKVSLFINLKIY